MKTILAPLIAAILIGGIPGVGSAQTNSDAMAQLAVTAATPADDLTLADYYAQKIAEYEKDVRQHAAMAQGYSSSSKGQVNLMAGHCKNIKSSLLGIVKEAKSLEAAHRQMAQTMGK